MIAALLDDVLEIEMVEPEMAGPVDKTHENRMSELTKCDEFQVYVRKLREELAPHSKVIRTIWVDKENKSRLCVQYIARTLSQEYFAATPTPASIRLVLALADALGWDVQTADMITAFLHAPVSEEIYVEPPKEDRMRQHDMKDLDYVWKLLKALYGRRSAPKVFQQWFAKIATECGFVAVTADSQLYYHKTLKVFMDMHVDDALMAGRRGSMSKAWKLLEPHMRFKIHPVLEAGQTTTHLGYVYKKLAGGGFSVKIVDEYIPDTLELAGMKGCRGVRTPCLGTPTAEDFTLMEKKLDDAQHWMYREVVGRVQFLAGNRDDILYACKECAKDLASPTEYSLRKVKRLLRYLEYTNDVGMIIKMGGGIPGEVTTYVDANWGADPITRRSTSAGSVFLGAPES